MTKLSVIVPCYNCASTLEEAVASIYSQDPGIPFDVTMLDDGSNDTTYQVMERLAAAYPHVQLLRHGRNLGGGAARNTAIAHSSGDLIFCLDSDDILGADFLKNMVGFWVSKRCDAVGMSTSINFRRSNINDIAYVTEFERPGRRVRLESFFEGPRCSLSVVFLMTRAAFIRSGGYPTEHGFDTQGMALRFLCNGMSAYTCPEARYYHRVDLPDSYYMREYAAEMVNWNWFCILDENLHIFGDKIKERILASDLFTVPGEPRPSPLADIVIRRPAIFAPNYRTLVRLGRDGVARRFGNSNNKYLQYWLGGYHLGRQDYQAAIRHFERALSLGVKARMIYYKMLVASLRLSGRHISGAESLQELLLYCQPYPAHRRPFHHQIVLRALRNKVTRGPVGFLNSRWIQLKQWWAKEPR